MHLYLFNHFKVFNVMQTFIQYASTANSLQKDINSDGESFTLKVNNAMLLPLSQRLDSQHTCHRLCINPNF